MKLSIVSTTTRVDRICGAPDTTSLVDPVAILTIESKCEGPFSLNWLYASAEAKSMFSELSVKLAPFRPDMLTVDQLVVGDTYLRWDVVEPVAAYRAWRNARQFVVVMSGEVYGGVLPITALEPASIVAPRLYDPVVRHEAVRLIPLLPAVYKTFTFDKKSVKAEIEIELGLIR